MFQREIMLSRRSVVMIILLIAFSSALYELIEIKTMALVGIFTVALFCSDIATKFLFNLLPRSFIDNCNDKAVLITGIYHYSTFLFHIFIICYWHRSHVIWPARLRFWIRKFTGTQIRRTGLQSVRRCFKHSRKRSFGNEDQVLWTTWTRRTGRDKVGPNNVSFSINFLDFERQK